MTAAATEAAAFDHEPPRAIPRWAWPDYALLFVALALACVVRVAWIDVVPSFDELWHMATTNGLGSPLGYYAEDVVHRAAMRQVSLDHALPLWAIWTDMPGVLHPPFFLIALRVWREIVGEGTLAAHAFSIVWSLVNLSFLFATARMTMGRSVAALLALGVAVSQTQVYLAQEIRPYAMLLALGSIAVWMMTRVELLGPTRRRAVGLGLMTLPLVMTHYFGLGGALAMGLFGLARLRPHRRAFCVSVAAAALFFAAAWVPVALRQAGDTSVGDVLLSRPTRDVTFELLMAAAAPFRLIAERDFHMERLPVISGVLFALPWLLVRRFRPLFPWALWLCCTVGCVVALDLARSTIHVAYVRYLALASPAVPLLFAGCVWPARRWLAYATCCVVLICGGIYLASRNVVALDAQSYDDVARQIAPRIAPGEPIVAHDRAPGFGWRAPVWIMTLSHEPGLFPRAMAIITRPMTPAMVGQLGSRTLWLVCDLDASPETLIPGGRVIETRRAAENIQIYRVEIVSPTSAPTTSSAGEAGTATRPSR